MRARWLIGLVVILMGLAACQPAADTTPPPPTFTPVGSASLGDLTWLDANANGLQDAGEEGLADVTVRLYDANGKMLAETRSDARGRYVFADLRPGGYTLEFAAPSGYLLTQNDQGGDDARDSDADPSSGKTGLISLSAGQIAAEWDAGFVSQVAALPTETPTPTPTPTPIPTPTPTSTPTLTPTPTFTPTPPPPPLEPEEVVFPGKFGDLQGRYYHAATEPAPLVVFMHWIGGDMNDWNEIAPWLQNRGLKNPYPNPGTDPWWDPTWFPPVPEGRSYAVFVFSFRGCQPGGCGKIVWEKWDETLSDAVSAMEYAATLPGVDPQRIVAIGASIGSGGAIISCGQVEYCSGALTLSPGGRLDNIQAIFNRHPQAHVWCLADENEIKGCEIPEFADRPSYRAIEIPGGGHGMELLQPNLKPLPMQLILDFLETVFGK